MTLPDMMRMDGHKLIRSSDHFTTLCPWHKERTPSCHVWDDHLKCFGCGKFVTVARYSHESGRPIYGSPMAVRKIVEQPAPNFENIMREASNGRPVADLAFDLGVDVEALESLSPKWMKERDAWAFPMRNYEGEMVGIRLRNENGRKWAIKHSHDGIFTPWPVQVSRRLYVCEGPSDTAAALSLGLFAIGRPSCRGAALTVVGFVQKWRISEVVIVSDADSAGLDGAKALQELLPVPSCCVMPPAKDLRECVRLGTGANVLESIVRGSIWKRPR